MEKYGQIRAKKKATSSTKSSIKVNSVDVKVPSKFVYGWYNSLLKLNKFLH